MVAQPDVWQELRALRAAPPDRVAESPERRAVFTAALRQAEQLAVAGAAAGYEAKPILSFYAMSQAGRAIAAAQLDDDWQLQGHGLSTADAAASLLQTEVSPAGGAATSFKRVGEAVGSEPLAGGAQLGSLWAANPDLEEVGIPASAGTWSRGLRFTLGVRVLTHPPGMDLPPQDPETTPVTTGGVVSVSVPVPGDTAGEVQANLAAYPTLRDARVMTFRMRMQADDSPWAEADEAMPGPEGDNPAWRNLGVAGGQQITMRELWDAQEKFASYLRWGDGHPPELLGLALPEVGGGTSPAPLMLWWALLLGLSSVARYQPALWVAALDLDASELAVGLERVLDTAEERVPQRLLEALRNED